MLNAARRLALVAGLMLVSGLATAQSSRPLNLMVPYPAGGLSDTIARIVEKPLGKALGLAIYAEGIETEIQRAAITAEGCDYWQGFLRAQPMPSDAVLALARTARGMGHG